MDINSVIYNTKAYKMFLNDKRKNTLSHATLILCEDGYMLEKYLKVFCKTLMCNSDIPCNNCRTCKLIDDNIYEDCKWYPEDKKIVVKDIDDLVRRSFFKPLENDKKIFVLNNAQDMNVQSQNKLLKTLEEPPENTFIILGATTLNTLLTTVLSRVKKFEIPSFTDEEIFDALKDDYTDTERLKKQIKLSSGKIGEAITRYESGSGTETENLAINVFLNLTQSSQVIEYSSKITKENIQDFLSITARIVREALEYKAGLNESVTDGNIKRIANEYTYGALIFISDKLREYEKAYYFNGNVNILADGVTFAILEGKRKWSK